MTRVRRQRFPARTEFIFVCFCFGVEFMSLVHVRIYDSRLKAPICGEMTPAALVQSRSACKKPCAYVRLLRHEYVCTFLARISWSPFRREIPPSRVSSPASTSSPAGPSWPARPLARACLVFLLLLCFASLSAPGLCSPPSPPRRNGLSWVRRCCTTTAGSTCRRTACGCARSPVCGRRPKEGIVDFFSRLPL